MITASEARTNKENYDATVRAKVKEKVLTILKTMSDSIEFHSRVGFDHIEFMPYSTSLFTSLTELEIAGEIFETILKQNGYEITSNNPQENILNVWW